MAEGTKAGMLIRLTVSAGWGAEWIYLFEHTSAECWGDEAPDHRCFVGETCIVPGDSINCYILNVSRDKAFVEVLLDGMRGWIELDRLSRFEWDVLAW